MGTQTIVFGYIELPQSSGKDFEETLGRFGFDEIFPFRHVFSSPKNGYRALMASFADSIKADSSEWVQWTLRFEELLLELNATSAKVCFESDESDVGSCFSYLKTDGAWLRWKIETEATEMDEKAIS